MGGELTWQAKKRLALLLGVASNEESAQLPAQRRRSMTPPLEEDDDKAILPKAEPRSDDSEPRTAPSPMSPT